MRKSKYSHNCCGEDNDIPRDEGVNSCQSPNPSTAEIINLTNQVRVEFDKIVKNRNFKKSTSRSGAPYVTYSEDELIYIPCWVHNVKDDLAGHSYQEFSELAKDIVDDVNEMLAGTYVADTYNSDPIEQAIQDNTHGVECRLRLKIPQKVPKAWLNPLFKENRRISCQYADVTWNGSSYDEDPQTSNNRIGRTDPNLSAISNSGGVTSYWNLVGNEANFKNYYSIPILDESKSRDEYFWGGPNGVVFNWPSLFISQPAASNPNTYVRASSYFDGMFYKDGTSFEREIKGFEIDPEYIALVPQALTDVTGGHFHAFEQCGSLAPVAARFPGINMFITKAQGGKGVFPYSTTFSWNVVGTASFGIASTQPSVTAGHELGHALGLQHCFGGAPQSADTRLAFVYPVYNNGVKMDFCKNTVNSFIPPFTYISEDPEDYNELKDFEQIEENEKIYVENIINDGVRLATRSFSSKVLFNPGTSSTPMSVENTYLQVEGEETALPAAEFFAILPRIPSFWGGSYIENADGSKSVVVNPSELNTTRSRSADFPDLYSLSGSSLPQLGDVAFNNQYYVYKTEYKFSGGALFAHVNFIQKAISTTQSNARAFAHVQAGTNYYTQWTDQERAIEQTKEHAENYLPTSLEGGYFTPTQFSTAPWAIDVYFDGDPTIDDYIYIGYPSEYNEAKQVLMDPLNGMVGTLGNGELTYSTYNSIMAQNDANEYTWTSYSATAKKNRVISMHSDVSIEDNSSDVMWYYADGDGQVGPGADPSVLPTSVHSLVRTQSLRFKKYRVTKQSHIDVLITQGLSFPDYVDIETIAGRKGPNITTYVPFCKMVEVINEETGEGTGEYIQSNEFDPFWYINFNWLNPRFPKYPENWPVSKLYDAEDNEGNPLCPCLHVTQHYYYEKPDYPHLVNNQLEIPFTLHLVEYIPINALTQDLMFANGSNVVDTDKVGGQYGNWNTYGEIPEDNDTDAYKLYMLYMYLDYKWNLNTDSSKYGNLATNLYTSDQDSDYFNKSHFFGEPKSSTACGNNTLHGAFMEVFVNNLVFKDHYPAARRYGSRIHSFPHGRGVFFENHILDNQCSDCDEPNIEIPYWAYTGMFGQGALPLPLKLNTNALADRLNVTETDLGAAPSVGFNETSSYPRFQLDIDGITDTGRDVSWTPGDSSANFYEKGGRSSMYLWGYGKYGCRGTSTYEDNSIYFSPSIVLKFAFGSTDPSQYMYNPFRHPDATIFDVHEWWRRENDVQIALAGQKSLGLNLERGAFNNIMHYDSGTTLKGYVDSGETPFEVGEKTYNLSAWSQYVFSPDQIAKMEALVESRYSIFDRALNYAEEIDLKNTNYSDSSEVETFFNTAKAVIQEAVEAVESEDFSNTYIVGDVDLTQNPTVMEACFSQDFTVCNSEYGSEFQLSIDTIDIVSLQPTNPYSYGPMFSHNGELKVYYYNPTLCCNGVWTLPHSTCVQGVDTLATVDCAGCGRADRTTNSKVYEVISAAGLNLYTVADKSVLYTGNMILSENSYYTFSLNSPKSVELKYKTLDNDLKNMYEKFKKYSSILNKMSNFAR